MDRPAVQRGLELLARLSLPAQYRLAAFIAWCVRITPNQVSRVTRANISVCFSERPRAWRERLYRESVFQTCCTLTELAAVWCWPVERVLAQITRHEVCAQFEQSERARLVLVPHLGSWETLALWLARQCRSTILYKPRDNQALDRFMIEARARAGATLVPIEKRGLRKLLLDLKGGGTVMILPDQRPPGNKARIDSTFFGADAPTTTLVHGLCSKVACDVFIATIYRSEPPGEFGLRIEPLEHARLAGGATASAQYLNDQVEQQVAEHVEQYQWGYRRFAKSAYQSTGQE